MIGLAITKYVFELNIRLQSYKIPIKREQKNEFYLPSVRNLSNFSDFTALYTSVVTDDYPRSQLDKVVETLKDNAEKRICTLFHCTAGKDRTGIVSMALLKSYGVSDEKMCWCRTADEGLESGKDSLSGVHGSKGTHRDGD